MKTEAQKSFHHGFILTEQELRRMLDSIQQQAKTGTNGTTPTANFEVVFRNGVVAESLEIDEVLSLENFGSKSISRLSIGCVDNDIDPKREIVVRFANLNDGDSEFSAAIHYSILGNDRDWVFISSSLLDERLGKIKVVNYSKFFKEPFMFAFLPVIMTVSFVLIPINEESEKAYVAKLEEQWHSGKIKDPIEAIIYLERNRPHGSPSILFIPLGLAISLSCIGWLCYRGILNFWPIYSYCWGDYLSFYEKKVAIRKYLLIVILTGLIVSIVAGVLVNKFHLGQ